ncbi:MAG: hypothetical protein HYY76_00130 [Acidobacteria bacterium]|nr:hypothetical protein [Acidobacteriota bacterium]
MAILVAGVAVDGVLGAEEARRLSEVLATTRWAIGLGEEAVAAVTKRGLDLIAEHGLRAVLRAGADAIPDEFRATTFALAIDVVLADGRLGSRENTFIDQLQSALQVEADLARKITEVLLIKNRASGRPDV